MCQYTNVPIGCATMANGNKHSSPLVNYSISKLFFNHHAEWQLAHWHIGTLANY